MKRARQGSSGDDGLPRKNVFLSGVQSGKAAKASLRRFSVFQERHDLVGGSKPSVIESSTSNKQMHLAGSTLGGARIATRSKTRQIEEINHLVSLNATTAAAPADAVQHAPALVAITSDLQLLKPTAITSNQQAGSGHQGAFLAAAKHAVVQTAPAAASANAAAAVCAHGTSPCTSRLHQLPSDDLQHILASAAAAPASSTLVHPSLLRHAGMSKHAHAQAQQQSPLRAAPASATILPALKKHSSAAGSASTGTIWSHHLTSNDGSGSNSKHTASGHATRLAAAAATAVAAASDTTTTSRHSSTRRVIFAPGPLSNATARTVISDDGHPATEGALAVPVRHLPQPYPMDLTRGNVLMLENLLGSDSAQSVTRLKRRVGLLPPIRPPRPHVCSKPAGRAEPYEGEEETAGALTAAGVADCRRKAAKDGVGHQVHLPPAVAHPLKPPGRAHAMSGHIESCI